MSDRLAVMNEGRIEQVGTPADVYENPTSAFVASFVGVSNLIEGDAARDLTGDPSPFSVRPEKIQITDGGSASGDEIATSGTIRDVLYLGAHTRYIVELPNGAALSVLRQNVQESSMDALYERGRTINLAWKRQHNRVLAQGGSREGRESG
jgi:putative spermidine/putrescine transport system ATP-binding protein